MPKEEFPLEQDELEAALAAQLQTARPSERAALYGSAYDEIYTLLLKDRGATAEEQVFGVSDWMMSMLFKTATSETRILEIGCGCGFASLELAKRGHRVTGIDVSKIAIEKARNHAQGLGNQPEFLWGEGVRLPFDSGSFDFVFSIEVVEHLHPTDVPTHLEEVHRVLSSGGRYWFATPNGAAVKPPGTKATHVHLKEWSLSELSVLLKEKGFKSAVSPWKPPKMRSIFNVPLALKLPAEKMATLIRSPRLNRLFMLLTGTMDCSVMATRI